MRNWVSKKLLKIYDVFKEPNLNKSLCLIYNGIASMISIAFIVMFFMGKTQGMLIIGIAGCISITLANVTDLIPSGIKRLAKKISDS